MIRRFRNLYRESPGGALVLFVGAGTVAAAATSVLAIAVGAAAWTPVTVVIAIAGGYAAVILLLIFFVTRLAARLAEIPSSLDCRGARHVACAGCACSCHH